MVPKSGITRTLVGIGAALALVALASAVFVFAQEPQLPGPLGPGLHRMGPPMGPMMGQGRMGPPMGRGWMGGGQMGPPMGPMRGGRGGLMGLRLAVGQLGLTDAQQDQIKKILESHKDEAQAFAKEAQPAHEALRNAVESNDVGAIQAASTTLASVIAKGAVLRAKVHAEVFGVLTDEQRAKAKELRDRAEQRLQQFRGMRKGTPSF